MSLDELRAWTLSLAADLAASAEHDPERNLDTARERAAVLHLTRLTGRPAKPGQACARDDLETRVERLYHAAVQGAGRERAHGSPMFEREFLGYAHAANSAWTELTAVGV